MLHKHQQKGPNMVCVVWRKKDETKKKKVAYGPNQLCLASTRSQAERVIWVEIFLLVENINPPHKKLQVI